MLEAKERYKDAPWLVTRELDIDRSLTEQNMEKECYDIVIAAGVINNVNDTLYTLNQLYGCLKKGGRLYMSEAVIVSALSENK